MDWLSQSFRQGPHSWVIKSLALIWNNNKVISFTKKVMSYWRTHMRLHTENNLIETEDIKYNVEYFNETHYHHCYFAFA